jgi:coupling of ubiquitin conjugation to ER degradation protein 1
MADDQQQINLPSLAVILVLSGLIIRYLFFSPPAGSSSSRPGRAGAGDPAALMRQREAAAERIMQMFPQVDRRTALWDLQRTGGNVAATTERILAGRLETVWLSFSPRRLYILYVGLGC